ncbi:MAG TPA: SAM-dependent methyltransferase [Cyanobacteria bacterium UBA11369]|nr:SAM-dependent methyltransferase [Cyanobacteria bacterium UBA11371]HBE33086.1 SAM-dependent methyltransferase [Cyanobacteria bacterium UBA11368]HBE47535.1 SAM-dependent methyltransferase [Cyanobacteria bacterium UBA11369]
MTDSEQIKTWYTKDLSQKKQWYSPVADAYNKVRPRYPKNLIHRVLDLAQLPSKATILELGCGAGNATVAFAKPGFSMVCLEPSKEACQFAQINCAQYPNVEIQNTTFEEYSLEPEKFNAVLAATSIHWIAPEIRYQKAADALQENGSLILLWNCELQPQDEVYQVLREVYQIYAPSLLARYESRENQQESLRSFGQSVLDSGRFKDLVSEQVTSEVTYSTNDYLMLLSTYSPYLELDPQIRASLFEGLREKIERNFGENLQLSYLSAFHIARKLN